MRGRIVLVLTIALLSFFNNIECQAHNTSYLFVSPQDPVHISTLVKTRSVYYNYGGHKEIWLKETTFDNWFYLLPDGKLYISLNGKSGMVSKDPLIIDLGSEFYGEADLFESISRNEAISIVRAVLQPYNLRIASSIHQNWSETKNELWVRGEGFWAYILPDGKLYRFNPDLGKIGVQNDQNELIIDLPEVYYDDLARSHRPKSSFAGQRPSTY